MTVPEGFQVKLFAGEPDVHQPIAFCLDDRGRVWVAEAYCYPIRRKDNEGLDRILIFEDTNGDGVFDKRTVFMEGLNLVSGLEVGFGGVWIGAAPYLLFVPMKDDKPAGHPQILLDGWAWQDTHETLNTFHLGAGRLALRLSRRLHPLQRRQARHAGSRAHADQRRRLALSSHPARLRGLRRTARAIHGVSISMTMARRFSRPASSPISFTSFRAAATTARRGRISIRTPSTTSRRSPIICITWAPSRTGQRPLRCAGGGHAHCGTDDLSRRHWPEEYRGQILWATSTAGVSM